LTVGRSIGGDLAGGPAAARRAAGGMCGLRHRRNTPAVDRAGERGYLPGWPEVTSAARLVTATTKGEGALRVALVVGAVMKMKAPLTNLQPSGSNVSVDVTAHNAESARLYVLVRTAGRPGVGDGAFLQQDQEATRIVNLLNRWRTSGGR
jgi:hypothetical protein